jgi:hypothetical protein
MIEPIAAAPVARRRGSVIRLRPGRARSLLPLGGMVALAVCTAASRADTVSGALRLREGYPVPPAECSVYVGYDRDRVLPGYRLPDRSGRLMCVPFTTTAAHPPPGYKGDYYVDEFSDAKLRARWQACRAQPACFKRVEAHIRARLPPNRDRRIRGAHARYLLGMVDQDDNRLDLEKIRRPAFFGSAPWDEDIAKADGRTFTVEFTAARGPYARYIMHLKGTIRLRGWYLRGSGVPDAHGHLTRALIIMSNGGGGHLVAIDSSITSTRRRVRASSTRFPTRSPAPPGSVTGASSSTG